MKKRLEVNNVPFPPGLMSTSRSATNMSLNYARYIENMYGLKSGAGAKRNGCSLYGALLPEGRTVIHLSYYVPAAGSSQVVAFTAAGEMYVSVDKGAWTLVHSGFSAEGLVRTAYFAGVLIICNGVDPVMRWDGNNLSPIWEWVNELGAGLAFVDAQTISVESDARFYDVGTQLKLTLASGDVETVVNAVAEANGVLTITLADAVADNTLSALAFQAFPPRVHAIYALHDRLWGFGSGVVQAQGISADVDRTRVFYTFKVGDDTAWHNDAGNLQYINFAEKLPAMDELVAMGEKDGMTAFFFRNYTQLWQGNDPTATGDMAWVKTIPVGAVHGNLVAEMPNDVALFTRYGARTLARTMQTEQLDIADLGSEMDPSLTEALSAMLKSPDLFRTAASFHYDRQRWFGFKVGEQCFVFQMNGAAGSGWSLFTGLFSQATAFTNTVDGDLLLAVGHGLYRYDTDVFSDAGAPINTKWWTPWISFSTTVRRWANKYVEVISEQTKAIPITFKRFKGYNSGTFVMNETTLEKAADYWNEAQWDEGFFDHAAPDPVQVRDHFVSDVLAYSVETNSTQGPLVLYGLRIHGTKER